MSDSAADAAAPTVRFARSGQEAPWDPASPSLLDFAEEQDLSPLYGCRSGSCQACKVAVTAGEIHYEVPPAAQPTDGFALLCCAKPKGDVTLDL